MRLPRRLSSRLALITAASVLAAVGLFTILAYLQIRQDQYQRLDEQLTKTVETFRNNLAVSGTPPKGLGTGDSDITTVAPVVNEVWYAGLNGQPGFQRSGSVEGVTDTRRVPLKTISPRGIPRSIGHEGHSYRAIEVHFDAPPGGLRRFGRFAVLSDAAEGTISRTRNVLGFGALASAALALLLVLFSARRGLRPLIEVQAAAEHVAESQDLGMRIRESGPGEVKGLASSMNLMLSRLQDSQGRLEGALEEQRRFAQDASHELRTPLTAIRGHIDILERYALPDGEREAVIGEMGEAADRMKRLVEGLLALARTEGRGGPGERISLVETLRETATLEGEAPQLDSAEEDVFVQGDREQLRGIFVNLVENGRRYGGKVEVHLRREDDVAIIEVRDDGPGIAREDRERVFDRFYRAPGLRSTPGSGLGLAIALQATERAGGHLSLIDSERGACFEVRLPIAPEGDPIEVPPGVQPVGHLDDEE